MNLWVVSLTVVLMIASFAVADELPTCQPKNFHFEYTECDSHGGRWRVSVPDPETCVGGAPNPPVRGKDCTFTCPPGHFLNITSDQDCHPCPAGSYSLGGGVRYEDWSRLPSGFSVEVESFEPAFASKEVEKDEDANCTKSGGWKPRGEFVASLGSHCHASLVYTANLVKAGKVTYTYQYTDKNTVFHFVVQNDQCQSYGDSGASRWPPMTDEGGWRTQSMNLKSGLNVLLWRTISLTGDESKQSRQPILIKDIEVTGVAFTSECTKCRSGTYSSEGSSLCTGCQKNTYSAIGAGKCIDCNKETEYSGEAAAKCEKRPACNSNDYFQYFTPCDANNQTQKMYKWTEPQICLPNLPGSVQLPPSGGKEACPPCNPGMHYTHNGCQFCPKDTYSDGSSSCQQCPVNSAATTELVYKWWNTMPPNMTANCISTDDDGCNTKSGWVPGKDHIHTGFGHADDAYLILMLDVNGFQGSEGIFNGKPIEIAQISFVFELDCENVKDENSQCQLFFMQESRSNGASVVQSWSGKKNKQSYTYIVTKTEPVTFSWAFQKTSWDSAFIDNHVQYKRTNDIANIFSINVTNTLEGGAASCKKCPVSSDAEGCVPCPDGHYIDPGTTTCKQCPANTIVNSNHAMGPESCQQCGEGLMTTDHKTCYSDCVYTAQDGKVFNFTELQGIHDIRGGFLFTSSGTQYSHNFQISLCPSSNEQYAMCKNNISTEQDESGNKLDNVVQSLVCRSTIIPPKRRGGTTLSAQPVSLGDSLTSISMDLNKTAELAKKLGFQSTNKDIFIHFSYSSLSPTSACLNGRSITITLKCDPKEDGNGMLELPPLCPDGTCDGCNFRILWHSRWACPSCREQDYEVVNGECIKGKQTIRYIPPDYCILSGNHKQLTKEQDCEMIRLDALTDEMKIIIAIIVGGIVLIATVMIISLCYCWKKNRKLEYKYMKLVGGKGSKGGDSECELPAAETCALEDDDEENEHFDAVHFKKQGFLGKLKAMTGGRGDGNSFETIQLTDRSDSAI